jgi:hypothetical protein
MGEERDKNSASCKKNKDNCCSGKKKRNTSQDKSIITTKYKRFIKTNSKVWDTNPSFSQLEKMAKTNRLVVFIHNLCRYSPKINEQLRTIDSLALVS